MKATLGIREINDIVDNTDIEYPSNIVPPASPINNIQQQRRYIPLVDSLMNRQRQQNAAYANPSGLTSEQMVDPATGQIITVFFQMNTKNQSFLDMHYYLKAKGIKNNKFHLLLFDQDLAMVDPYDPGLPLYLKQKIFVECQRNFFYYIREVVRVQSQGGPYVRYKLDPGNLALNFCFTLNLNIYEEQPRQTGCQGCSLFYNKVI